MRPSPRDVMRFYVVRTRQIFFCMSLCAVEAPTVREGGTRGKIYLVSAMSICGLRMLP